MPSADGGSAMDGGAPDGGAVACTEDADGPDAGSKGLDCAALLPSLGPPVEHRFREVTDSWPSIRCSIGGSAGLPSDGNGVVLHPARADTFFGYTVDRTGKTLGTYGSPQADDYYTHPLRDSFAGEASYTGALGWFPLEFFGEDGAYRGRGATVNGSRPWNDTGVLGLISSSIPPEQRPRGCGDDVNGASTFRLVHYDAGASVVATSETFGCFAAERAGGEFLTNRAGLTLLLVYGGSGDDANRWTAYWLAPDLRVRAKWHPTESLEGVRMGLLNDDSIALQVNWSWAYRVRSGATTLEPAPCWMQQRPSTEVTMIRSGGGYAVKSFDRSQDRGLEIVLRDGTSCGFLDLGEPSGGCFAGRCSVGLDGTITRSTYAVDAGAGEPQICVLPFWPGVLGPSVR